MSGTSSQNGGVLSQNGYTPESTHIDPGPSWSPGSDGFPLPTGVHVRFRGCRCLPEWLSHRTAAPDRPLWHHHHPWPFLGSPSWQSHGVFGYRRHQAAKSSIHYRSLGNGRLQPAVRSSRRKRHQAPRGWVRWVGAISVYFLEADRISQRALKLNTSEFNESIWPENLAFNKHVSG